MSDLPPTLTFGADALKRMVPALFLYPRTTATLTIGVAAQFIAFIVLARNLGVQQFGVLVLITAATAIPTNLCGLGAGEVLIRRVAREPTHYPMLLGHYIIMILSSGIILVAMSIAGMFFLVRAVENPVENVVILSIFAISNILGRCRDHGSDQGLPTPQGAQAAADARIRARCSSGVRRQRF